jgi:MFS family permease
VLASQLSITVVGYGFVGLGLSVIIPEIFRMAGKIKGIQPSVGISMISGIGFSGFLLGPVVLGYISNTYNLKISFLTLLLLTCCALLIAFVLLSRTTSEKNS